MKYVGPLPNDAAMAFVTTIFAGRRPKTRRVCSATGRASSMHHPPHAPNPTKSEAGRCHSQQDTRLASASSSPTDASTRSSRPRRANHGSGQLRVTSSQRAAQFLDEAAEPVPDPWRQILGSPLLQALQRFVITNPLECASVLPRRQQRGVLACG